MGETSHTRLGAAASRRLGYYRIRTPTGWIVPGMTGADRQELCERYAKVMYASWESLAARGYEVEWKDPQTPATLRDQEGSNG